MSTIINYISELQYILSPSSDPFGNEAKEIQDPCTLDIPIEPVITGCCEGIGRVEVINYIFKQIVANEARPNWLRRNGSINLHLLREDLEMSDIVASHLLTDQGYIKLSDLHIMGRESINQWSKAQVKNIQKNTCPSCQSLMEQIAYCPALSLKLMYKNSPFNPRPHKEDLKDDKPPFPTIKQFQVTNIQPFQYKTSECIPGPTPLIITIGKVVVLTITLFILYCVYLNILNYKFINILKLANSI